MGQFAEVVLVAVAVLDPLVLLADDVELRLQAEEDVVEDVEAIER